MGTHTQPQIHFKVPPATRLNIGSGGHSLRDWCNIDNDPAACADLTLTVPPIPYDDDSIEEIYAGHFLEHLTQEDAGLFLDECWRCLKPGGKLGIVVPDIREVMQRYLSQQPARVEYPIGNWRDCRDLDQICDLFLYSTAQDSHHQWNYDLLTLGRLLEAHKFTTIGEINRWLDPRVPVGAWYQFGLDSVKEG